MDSILVTPENLKKKASEVDTKAAEYYKEYQNLIADIQNFTSTDWTGEDATLFRQKVEGFESDFSKMKQLMEEYATFLRQAATNYVNTQGNVKNSIAGLR